MNTKGSDAGNVPQDAESPFGKSKYDDLWGRPGYLVRRLHQIHIGLFAEACDGMDLTAVQYAMLSVLYSGEEFDQLSLSKAVGIDRTSGADVIKRLVRRGLATREPSEADRRAQVVRITEEWARLRAAGPPADGRSSGQIRIAADQGRTQGLHAVAQQADQGKQRCLACADEVRNWRGCPASCRCVNDARDVSSMLSTA